MDDEDRYRFDLNGYLVVPDVLDAATLAGINRLIDAHCAALRSTLPDPCCVHIHSPLALGPELRALLDQPRIAEYLEEWLGAGYHLDHEYGLVMCSNAARPCGAPHIHGGGTPHEP